MATRTTTPASRTASRVLNRPRNNGGPQIFRPLPDGNGRPPRFGEQQHPGIPEHPLDINALEDQPYFQHLPPTEQQLILKNLSQNGLHLGPNGEPQVPHVANPGFPLPPMPDQSAIPNEQQILQTLNQRGFLTSTEPHMGQIGWSNVGGNLWVFDPGAASGHGSSLQSIMPELSALVDPYANATTRDRAYDMLTGVQGASASPSYTPQSNLEGGSSAYKDPNMISPQVPPTPLPSVVSTAQTPQQGASHLSQLMAATRQTLLDKGKPLPPALQHPAPITTQPVNTGEHPSLGGSAPADNSMAGAFGQAEQNFLNFNPSTPTPTGIPTGTGPGPVSNPVLTPPPPSGISSTVGSSSPGATPVVGAGNQLGNQLVPGYTSGVRPAAVPNAQQTAIRLIAAR